MWLKSGSGWSWRSWNLERRLTFSLGSLRIFPAGFSAWSWLGNLVARWPQRTQTTYQGTIKFQTSRWVFLTFADSLRNHTSTLLPYSVSWSKSEAQLPRERAYTPSLSGRRVTVALLTSSLDRICCWIIFGKGNMPHKNDFIILTSFPYVVS